MKGYRKFTIAALIVVLAWIGLMYGKLTSDAFASICVWVIGLFGAANAAPSVASAVSALTGPKGTP